MNASINNKQMASDLRQRIANLEALSVEDLKGEMGQLKILLLDNPAACLLLHNEDIGIMVASLRKITGMALASASTPKAKAASTKPKKLTAAELAAALDDEDF